MTYPVRLADFRPLPLPAEDTQCMICLGTPDNPVFHESAVASKVHHVACFGCIKQWAIASEEGSFEASCPLCKYPLSERFLVKLCSIFTEKQIKERGDLWQSQYVELMRSLVASDTNPFSEQEWLEKAAHVEEELRYFLLSVRHFFVKNITHPRAVEHFIRSIENFREKILMLKSMSSVSELIALALLFPMEFSFSSLYREHPALMHETIDRLADHVLTAQQQMIKDYQTYARHACSFRKMALMTSAVTLGLFWTFFSYAESERDSKHSFSERLFTSNLPKLGLAALVSIAAYVKMRMETHRVSQDFLLKKIEGLSLE